MNEHLTLTRRTALITGATSGIGFHTAAALARGHRIVVTGRDEEADAGYKDLHPPVPGRA